MRRFDIGVAGGDSLFRGLLESAPDAIVIVDQAGDIGLVNSQTERLFGYSRDELLGQPVEQLMPPRFRAHHPQSRDAYAANPRVRQIGAGLELYGLGKNGQEFPVEISLSPLDTEYGPLVIASIRDVTDRKRAERALQDRNVELENASLAQDRFLASMSHELRTPLNAIIGFTGTLLMRLPGPLTSEQDHQLRTVKSSARHLLLLINDLLDLARIGSGKMELDPEVVHCQTVLTELVATLRPSAEAKGLTLELRMPAQNVTTRVDRRAMNQILINLINNAVKFTERGAVRVTLVDPGDVARVIDIEIADSGIGIKRHEQESLFQAFTQVGFSAHRYGGTGLGLHLSQKLAELLGGSIRFKSDLGEGSTFVLSLPRS